MGGMMTGYGGYGLMSGWGILFNIIILIGIVVLIVWAVKQFTRSNDATPRSSGSPGQPLSARDILDMRYARGELTREEYQAMVQDIG